MAAALEECPPPPPPAPLDVVGEGELVFEGDAVLDCELVLVVDEGELEFRHDESSDDPTGTISDAPPVLP